MIESARGFADGTVLACDIAIIGAGAAGIALALGLIGKSARQDILIIEAGGRKFDFAAQTEFFSHESVTPQSHPPLDLYRRRMLGGTTTVWGGRCIALMPDDVAPRPELSRDGWPVNYDELSRYYARALEVLEAGAAEFSALDAFPSGSPPPAQASRNSMGVNLDQIERFSPPTNLAQRYLKTLAATGRVRLLIDAPCVALLTNDTGTRAMGCALRVGDKTITVEAGATVLAAGGLETPRLLLASRKAKNCGIGNDHDAVGRYYMTHATATLGELRFAPAARHINFDYAKSHDGVWCRRLIQLDHKARRRHRLPNFVMRPTIPMVGDPGHGNPILSAAFVTKRFLVPEYARRLSAMPGAGSGRAARSGAGRIAAHAGNIAKGAPSLIAFAAFWARNRWFARRQIPSLFLQSRNATYPLEINVEQLPERCSRVTLGDTCDPLGVPRLKLDWRMHQGFEDQLLRIYEVMDDAFARAGIGKISLSDEQKDNLAEICEAQGGHHIGTARMAARAQDGVVDRNCEVWGTKGLFVAGSAVFPTCGFANPTLTLVALALRLADRLAEQN